MTIPAKGPWTVDPLWSGETCFIVAGGPSARDFDWNTLRGRRVIAVNSSYEKVPFADFLFFGDARWWNDHRPRPKMAEFKGRIVTCSGIPKGPRLLNLKRQKPVTGKVESGYADARDTVASQRTSLQGAMNLAGHLGVAKIILIAADMGRAPDGASHHHSPHRWVNRPGNACWDEQMNHLKLIAPHLAKRNIEVVNTSTVSRIEWWPKKPLTEVLNEEKSK